MAVRTLVGTSVGDSGWGPLPAAVEYRCRPLKAGLSISARAPAAWMRTRTSSSARTVTHRRRPDICVTQRACSYRGYGPAGPPRGQWACPPVGAAYGGCTAGRWGERDRRSELRFCARATSSENAVRRPQRPRPSSYLSTGDCHRLSECSPRSNPRETDRKHQALTVCRATR